MKIYSKVTKRLVHTHPLPPIDRRNNTKQKTRHHHNYYNLIFHIKIIHFCDTLRNQPDLVMSVVCQSTTTTKLPQNIHVPSYTHTGKPPQDRMDYNCNQYQIENIIHPLINYTYEITLPVSKHVKTEVKEQTTWVKEWRREREGRWGHRC